MRANDLLRHLLLTFAFERAEAPYRLLQVKGPDAAEFLHRLCSQDVLGMADGALQPAAFLDAKGKLLVTCLVFRLGDAFWLETQAEQSERLAALLERYHFTEKLAISRPDVGACHETVEPSRDGPAARGSATWLDGHVTLRYTRRGVAFTRAYGAAPGSRPSAVAPPLAAERAECLNLLAGLVRVGVDTEPTTLALEAELDDHISTTKGCYTGQEIVARIHTYGHTNRKLCLLWLAEGTPITAPAPLHEVEDQLAVGRVMRAVPVPGREERLGVGFLPRDFQAIGTKLALADGTAVEVIGYEPLAPASA